MTTEPYETFQTEEDYIEFESAAWEESWEHAVNHMHHRYFFIPRPWVILDKLHERVGVPLFWLVVRVVRRFRR